jgi:Fic family protein
MRTVIINSSYLDLYKKKQPITLVKHFNKIKELPFNKETFGYSASMSSVFSSMIEGNTIDFDTYLKYSASGMNTKSKPFKEIEDLIKAYEFASNSHLNIDNFLQVHSILSNTLIPDEKYSGKIRDKEVYIFGGGIKVYTGAAPDIVNEEVNKLFADISILLTTEISITEIFYFASMIHLVFAHIHPFADGNGRSARLLEKWFLAQKLGNRAWFIQSERLYQERIKSYYENINIGSDYSTLNYDLSIHFLLMLPMALTKNK